MDNNNDWLHSWLIFTVGLFTGGITIFVFDYYRYKVRPYIKKHIGPNSKDF